MKIISRRTTIREVTTTVKTTVEEFDAVLCSMEKYEVCPPPTKVKRYTTVVEVFDA